jgi:hypothetical protein
MATPTKRPPLTRRDPWDWRPWKPGELPAVSSGSAAGDIYRRVPSSAAQPADQPALRDNVGVTSAATAMFPHLRSVGQPSSVPVRRSLPKEKK